MKDKGITNDKIKQISLCCIFQTQRSQNLSTDIYSRYIFFLLNLLVFYISTPVGAQNDTRQLIITPVHYDSAPPPRYARSFQNTDKNIYVQGGYSIHYSSNQLHINRQVGEFPFPAMAIKEGGMNSFFIRHGFFISLGYRIRYHADSGYTAKVWRSIDDLQSNKEETALFNIPEAGKVNYGSGDEWAGLFCHRGIIELSNGSLLACVYGNFESDSVIPTHPQSRLETKFKLRSFLVKSTDKGKTWNYLTSLAVPEASQTDDSEGFNESSIVLLNDGRLMEIIRTGHFTPPVLCFSADTGKSWTKPMVNPELGQAACDPLFLKLKDGRIALAYGEMIKPMAVEGQHKDGLKESNHLRKCKLAISLSPAADHWQSWDITGYGDRSAYATIFQIQSNLLLYQVDGELYIVQIPVP